MLKDTLLVGIRTRSLLLCGQWPRRHVARDIFETLLAFFSLAMSSWIYETLTFLQAVPIAIERFMG